MDTHRMISDLRLLDDPEAAPRGPAARLARFLGEIVAAGSVLSTGEQQTVVLRCRRRPNRRPCPGHIHVGRDADSDELLWSCTGCGDHGVITHWQRSRWDLGPEMLRGRIVSLAAERARRAARRPTPPDPTPRVLVYELEVELVQAPVALEERVARRLRLSGEHTLQQLHAAIEAGFARAADEPFEFMFGAPYEPETRRFAGPGATDLDAPANDGGAASGEELVWPTQSVRLDSLGLRPGQTFGYVFAFDEEWVHRVTVISAREISGPTVAPRVIERCGQVPRPPAADDEDDPGWDDLDAAFPMTSLYGPYVAEEGMTSAQDWLALDDLERQLLVVEAHTRDGLSRGHPAMPSLVLHALVHSLAETHLAEGGAAAARCPKRGPRRHQFIHQLGGELVRELLASEAAPAPAPSRPRRRPSERA